MSDPNAASPMREEAIRRVQESIAATAPQTLEDLGSGWQLTRVFRPEAEPEGGAGTEGVPASMDLRVFHAGLDQNSSEVGGGAACSVCACALAQWLVEHEGELPVGPGELDDIVRQGVGVWQQLRQSPVALAQFPDGHFDLEFALQGLAQSPTPPAATGAADGAGVPSSGGPLEAVPGHSFIGFLALPEVAAPAPTEKTQGSDGGATDAGEGGDGSGEGDSPQKDSCEGGSDASTSGGGEGADGGGEAAMGSCGGDDGGEERAAAEPGLLSSLRGLLQGSLGVEDLWREMASLAPAVFVVAWHDHFFALALRASGGAAVVDSLGSRLHDGNDSAYVIDFPAGPSESRPYSTAGGAALPGVRLEARLDEVGDGGGEAGAPGAGAEPSGGAAAAARAGGAGALQYITELLAGERVRQLARELAPRGPGGASDAPPSEQELAAAVERALRTLQIEFHRVAVPPL